jgi:signal transduction histidine kinase
MLDYLKTVWKKVSRIGISDTPEHPEEKQIIASNQLMAVLIVSFSFYFLVYLALGIYMAAGNMLLFISTYFVCFYLTHRKLYLTSRSLGFFLQITFIFFTSITAGAHARIIDFLIIAAIVPSILFDSRQLLYIFFFTTQCFVLYVIYTIYSDSLPASLLSIEKQTELFYATIPFKFVSALILTFMILKSNTDQEEKFKEQNSILEGQKNYYYNLLDKLPIDVVMHDKNFNFIFINKNAVKDEELRKWLVGKNNLQYVMYRNLNLKIAEDRDRSLKEAWNTKQIQLLEETMIDRNGKLVSSIKGTIPILDEKTQEPTSLISYSINITERKQAEEKLKETVIALERTNKELKHFAFAVSHDLKTPLRNISTYLQLLKRKNNLDTDSNEMIDSAVKSVKHLHQLINDIFLYTSSDQINLNREEIDIKKLVGEIAERIADFRDEKNASILVPNWLPNVYMNPTHALHLFSNLIINGIKYNQSEKPVVEIAYSIVDGKVVYAVKDNGIGIQPAYHQQIFDMFKRLHSQEEYEGTGVGLSLCKKIVELYGGTIDVSSDFGKGSIFSFTLPMVERHTIL